MNKIKFKIKIPNKIVNLNNYFIDQFKKLKRTSIGGGRVKTSSMNKSKRKSYKRYNGQGRG